MGTFKRVALDIVLQPDRRVEIEVLGSRQVAAEDAPAAAGVGPAR